MKEIIRIVRTLMPHGPMDVMGVGVLHFKENRYQAFEATNFEGDFRMTDEPRFYFDLASLTKPLTNSLSYFLKPEIFSPEMLLCLSHRGGLPAWGLLPHKGWREQILSYSIKESETLYSDFSALRVMLEFEKKGLKQKELCQKIWDKETMSWLDLPFWYPVPQFGYKSGRPNFGQVHDPNAYVIKEFTSHAGLFSTTDGLCRTLLSYQKATDFLGQVKKDLGGHTHRFSFGWDRVVNPQETLAGKGCSFSTFGHLGFTGTSIWIDPEKMTGHVILSNATKYHWYDKQLLNDLRRAIGEVVWTL